MVTSAWGQLPGRNLTRVSAPPQRLVSSDKRFLRQLQAVHRRQTRGLSLNIKNRQVYHTFLIQGLIRGQTFLIVYIQSFNVTAGTVSSQGSTRRPRVARRGESVANY